MNQNFESIHLVSTRIIFAIKNVAVNKTNHYFVLFINREAENIVYGGKHAALIPICQTASEQIQTETGIICGDVSIL